jgi:hypothetical protein
MLNGYEVGESEMNYQNSSPAMKRPEERMKSSDDPMVNAIYEQLKDIKTRVYEQFRKNRRFQRVYKESVQSASENEVDTTSYSTPDDQEAQNLANAVVAGSQELANLYWKATMYLETNLEKICSVI